MSTVFTANSLLHYLLQGKISISESNSWAQLGKLVRLLREFLETTDIWAKQFLAHTGSTYDYILDLTPIVNHL